jgi:hypothetical protein
VLSPVVSPVKLVVRGVIPLIKSSVVNSARAVSRDQAVPLATRYATSVGANA